MSNLDVRPQEATCGGRQDVSAEPVHELNAGRTVALGESTNVRRLLPNLGRRMIGAWCFVDHYGPDDIADEPGMQVPPHPHMGLQTVSWLHDGHVFHRDSVGSQQLIRPRELGLMTSGAAIAHSEESPRDHDAILHGAQLWVALPERDRHVSPRFEHHPNVPVVTARGLTATVILGEFDGALSPGTTYSPLVGVDIALRSGTDTSLPLERDFEYAVLSMSGIVEVDGEDIGPGSLLYLGSGRKEVRVRANTDGGLMLLGGEPFGEKIIMWWNFIGRTHDEIAEARAQWNADERFGTVHGYDGERLLAPSLPAGPLIPRGAAGRKR
ncbi:MAG: pirin family protein [Corynebacteriales bacterium]|nr:pirin family protein [Mycobacteriales bacterium]